MFSALQGAFAMSNDETASNEVIIRSGRKIAVGSEWWEIRDSGEPVKFTDMITEARHINGVVYLSFGAGIVDANNEGICDLVSRLRMNLGSAQFLHNLLGNMISNALKPTDASKAN
jgi:hypothetical protein